MPALTPKFVMSLESRMSNIIESQYATLNANLFWQQLAKLRPMTGKREVITWLLSTAQIKDQGDGGNIQFDDIVSQYSEITNDYAGTGLKLKRAELEDVDGGGIELASQWSSDIGQYIAYWPQKATVKALKEGHDIAKFRSYDLKAFFATDHPYNPFRVQVGTYANLHTGSAYAIDESVADDIALKNLSGLYAKIAGIKMPNGEDPRGLRPGTIYASPALFPRIVQLTSAKFLARVASSGAASADVELMIKALGFAQPVQVDELAGYENDKTYFVATKSIATSQLGALVYGEREAFKINYYDTVTQAELNRKQELEWHCLGRNKVSPGHPYLLHKVQGGP